MEEDEDAGGAAGLKTPRSPSSSAMAARRQQDAYNNLGEFASLHRYLHYIAKHKQFKNNEEANALALEWVSCWQYLGYTYRGLLQNVAMAVQRVEEGVAKNDELPKKLWKKMNNNRDRLPKVSFSFVVDRTIEHFKLVIEKRLKERQKLAADQRNSGEELDSQGSQQGHNTDEEASTSGRAPDNPEQQQSSSSIAEDVIRVEKDFSDFMWAKLGSVIGHPQPTGVAVNAVVETVKQTQVHPSTLIGWYEIDQEYNNGRLFHFPPLLKAYFEPVCQNLPQVCPLEALIPYIIEFCFKSPFRGRFKVPDAYQSFSAAVNSITSEQPQEPQEEPETSRRDEHSRRHHDDHHSRHHHHGRPQTPPEAYPPPPPDSPNFSPNSPDNSSSSASSSNNHRSSHHHHHHHERDDRSRRRHRRAASSSSYSEDDDSSHHRSNRPRSSSSPSSSSNGGGRRSREGGRNRPPPRPPSPPDQKLDARTFRFEHGDDPHFDRLPNHPLHRRELMPGKVEDKLVVFCHIEVFGEAGVQSDIYQIGAHMDAGESLLYPIFYPDVPRSVLKRLGFVTQSERGRELENDEVHYQHSGNRERLRIYTLDEALKKFVAFLHKELRKTDYDGVILVFGFSECVGYLMRAIALSESGSVHRDISIVKGYCVLEGPVREHYLRNLEGDVRIPIEQAWRIVFGTSKRRLEAADDKAFALCKLSKALYDANYDLGSVCLRFDRDLVRDFEEHLINIEDLKHLRRFIKKDLEKAADPLILRGIFELFPNVFCQERFSSTMNKCRAVSAVFVECLAACGITIKVLKEREQDVGSNELFSELKNMTLPRLQKQTYAMEEQFRTCLLATIEWLTKSKEEEREANAPPPRPPSPAPVNPGPRTPPESPISPGESDIMSPEDFIEKQEMLLPPLPVDEEFRPLNDYLLKIIADTTEPRLSERISSEMIALWKSSNYNAQSLSRRINNDLNNATVREQFRFSLTRREGMFPQSWHGFGIDFLIKHTMDFFIEDQGKSLPTSSAIDSFLSVQRQQATEGDFGRPGERRRSKSSTPQEIVIPKQILNPKALGLVNTKRKFPISDMKLLGDFLDEFPEQARDLDAFCDELKDSYPMWSNTATRIIILDLLKLMHKSKYTVAGANKTLQRTLDVESLKEEMNYTIFGYSSSRRRPNYSSSSDFDIYRNVMDKLIDLLDPNLLFAPKRKHEEDSEEAPEKKRRKSVRNDDLDSLSDELSNVEEEEEVEDVVKMFETLGSGQQAPLEFDVSEFAQMIHDGYVSKRVCLKEMRDLHECVFFSTALRRKIKPGGPSVQKVANDFVSHLSLMRNQSFVKDLQEKKSFKEFLNLVRVNLRLSELPSSAQSLWGSLVSVLHEYCEQSSAERLPEDILAEKFEASFATTGLAVLRTYTCQCLMSVSREILTEKGLDCQVEGLRDSLLNACDSWIKVLTENGFDACTAISSFMSGTFEEYMAGILRVQAEAEKDLLCQLTFTWVESLVKRRGLVTLPGSHRARRMLKDKAIQILLDLEAFGEEDKDKLRHLLPENMVDYQEAPLNDVEMKTEEESKEGETEIKQENIITNGDIKEEPAESESEPFIDDYGLALTISELNFKPQESKFIKLDMCGDPRFKLLSKLDILPAEGVLEEHKVSVKVGVDRCQANCQVLVEIQNETDEPVVVKERTVLAKVKAVESSDLEEPVPREVFMMKVIKRYLTLFGVQGITEDSGKVVLGNGFVFSAPKSTEVNARIYGSKSCYTLEALVFFLVHCDQEYLTYLNSCFESKVPIVRQKDAKLLKKYFFGSNEINLRKSKPIELKPDMGIKVEPAFDVKYKSLCEEYENHSRTIDTVLHLLGTLDNNTKEDGPERLEKSLSLAKEAGCDLTQLQTDLMQQPNYDYLKSLMAKLQENLKIQECDPLIGAESIEAIVSQSQKQTLKDIIALVKLLKGEGEMLEGLQKVMESEDAVLDITTAKEFIAGQLKPATDIKEDTKLALHMVSADGVLANLVTATTEEPSETSLVCAQSRFLSVPELDLTEIQRDMLAIKFFTGKHPDLLKKITTIHVDRQEIKDMFEAENVDPEVKDEVERLKELKIDIVVNSEEENLARPMCTRASKLRAEMPDMEDVEEVLNLVLICLANQEIKTEDSSEPNPPVSVVDQILHAPDEETNLPDLQGEATARITSSKLSPLLTPFTKYLSLSNKLSESEAFEMAQELVGAMASAGMTMVNLEETFLKPVQANKRNDEVMERTQAFLAKPSFSIPDSITMQAFQLIIYSHFSGKIIPPPPPPVLNIKERISFNQKTKRERERQAETGKNSEASLSGLSEDEEERRPAKRMRRSRLPEPPSPEKKEETVESNVDWFQDMINEDLAPDQTPVDKSTWQNSVPAPKSESKDPKASLSTLKKYYESMLEHSKMDDRVTSAILVNCWVIAMCDYTKLLAIYEATIMKGKKAFVNCLSSILEPYEKILPPGVRKGILILWTYDYFASKGDISVNKSVTGKKQPHCDLFRSCLLDYQTKATAKDGKRFQGIKNFYRDVIRYYLKKNLQEANNTAEKCIQTWKLVGISFEDLKSLASAAGLIEPCLKEFIGKGVTMFDELSCFMDSSVDTNRLLEYTVLYFRANFLVREYLLANRDQALKQKTFEKIKDQVLKTVLESFEKADKATIIASYNTIMDKLSQHWDMFTLAAFFTEYQKSIRGIPKAVVRLSFQHGLISNLYFLEGEAGIPGQYAEHIFMLILKELLLHTAKVQLTGAESFEEGEVDLDVEDGEVLSDSEEEEEKAKPSKEDAEKDESTGEVFSISGNLKPEDLDGCEESNPEKIDIIPLLRSVWKQGLKIESQDQLLLEGFKIPGDLETSLAVNKESEDGEKQYYDVQSLVHALGCLDKTYGAYVQQTHNDHPDSRLVHASDWDKLCAVLKGSGETETDLMSDTVVTAVKTSKELQLKKYLQHFRVSVKPRNFTLEQIQAPKSESSEYEELFKLYFKAVYSSGLQVQQNWDEAARLASEELIKTWKTSQCPMEELLENVRIVCKETNWKRQKKKYKTTFHFLLDSLMDVCDGLPPCLRLVLFVKDSMTMCEEVIETREALERARVEAEEEEEEMNRQAETHPEGIEDKSDGENAKKADEAMEVAEPGQGPDLEELDLEALRQKQLEIEANIAANEDDESDENGNEETEEEPEPMETTEDNSPTSPPPEEQPEEEEEEKTEDNTNQDDSKAESKKTAETMLSFVKSAVILNKESNAEVSTIPFVELISEKRLVSKLTGMVEQKLESFLKGDEQDKERYLNRYSGLMPFKDFLLDEMRAAFDVEDDEMRDRNCHAIASCFTKMVALSGVNLNCKDNTRESVRDSLAGLLPEEGREEMASEVADMVMMYLEARK